MRTLKLKGIFKIYLWTNKNVKEGYIAFFFSLIRKLLYKKIIFSYWLALEYTSYICFQINAMD